MKIEFHHVCIETNSYAESIAFYRDLFGFEILHETKDFHGRDYNTWLQQGKIIIELQTRKRNSQEQETIGNIGLMHICFSVENLDAFILELERKGFTGFLDGKKKYRVMDGYLSKLRAPEGTIIELRE